jgi:hypothetical protein
MDRKLKAGLFAALAWLAWFPAFAADTIVHNEPITATSPLPAGSCIYVDQGPGTDTKLCSGYSAAIGAAAVANNLSDLANAATARTNLGVGTAAIAYPLGWIAGQNPTGAIIVAGLPSAITISAIVGRLEVAEGSAGTVSVYSAPSGTDCSSGTNLTNTMNLNTNGTAFTNQTLSGTTTSVPSGSSLCLVTTGTFTANRGAVTIYAHSP